MGLGKKIIDLAKSNLNQLLEKAADVTDPKRRLAELSDAELEAELARRKATRLNEQRIDDAKSRIDGKIPADRADRERMAREREARARAAREAAARSAASSSARPGPRPAAAGGSQQQRQAPPPRRPAPPASETARYYERLEVPNGSDWETVKAAYRKLMRKYHPDMHANKSPEKQKAAHEVSQALTQAYTELEKVLNKR